MSINADEIKEYLSTLGPQTKIYIGVDSQAFSKEKKDPKTGQIIRNKKGDPEKEWWAHYYMVVAVHKNGRNGCKLFYEHVTERDYSSDRKKPAYRLMQEAVKAVELYHRLLPMLLDYEFEIHLDLNPNKKYASSSVISQAVGYIAGSCNVIPLVKPESWCATHAADRLVRQANK